MECKECGKEVNRIVARGSCERCYRTYIEAKKSAICRSCSEYKPIKARGLCNKCYVRWQRYGDPIRTVRPVKGAKRCSYCCEKPVHAKNLCKSCYARYLQHGSPERVKVKRITECEYCGKVKLIRAHGFCGACYSRLLRYGTPEFRQRPTAIRECVVCGKTRKIASKNVCTICYGRYFKTGKLSTVSGKYTHVDPIALGLPKVTEKDVQKRRELRNKAERLSRKNNRKRFKSYELKKSFGITLEDYENLLKNQNGVCAICGNPETATTNGGELRKLSVDHDHETGEVRGLLCTNCNNGLGRFKDSPDLFQKALNYLT